MVNPIRIYKTLEEAYNALLKGFRSIQKREPNAIENQMIKAEAEGKIKSQGDNISILPQDKQEGIMSQASGTKKPDLDRPFVTEEEMSAFTLEDNARKLNKAKGFPLDKIVFIIGNDVLHIDNAFNSPQSVYAVDVDGDGDMDVLGADIANDEIAWFENNGFGSFSAKKVIGYFDYLYMRLK